jgi:hypothetical protein
MKKRILILGILTTLLALGVIVVAGSSPFPWASVSTEDRVQRYHINPDGSVIEMCRH